MEGKAPQRSAGWCLWGRHQLEQRARLQKTNKAVNRHGDAAGERVRGEKPKTITMAVVPVRARPSQQRRVCSHGSHFRSSSCVRRARCCVLHARDFSLNNICFNSQNCFMPILERSRRVPEDSTSQQWGLESRRFPRLLQMARLTSSELFMTSTEMAFALCLCGDFPPRVQTQPWVTSGVASH